MTEQTFSVANDQEAQLLCGRHDVNIKRIEQDLGVTIVARGGQVTVQGDDAAVQQTLRLLTELRAIAQAGQPVHRHEVEYALKLLRNHVSDQQLAAIFQDRIEVPSRHRFVTPKTLGQKAYVDAIRTHDIVFGIGPAGTGKTYLAMAMAVSALTKGEVSRILLTRPAVEAGEQLGFLPGDLEAKITPYLRPLYHALYDMMEPERIQRALERGTIEVAPLAYMRGRTLNDSFIILDEAQNSTPEQMKMFLTRLGFDAKTVITGDVTQIDLPTGKHSGLVQAERMLRGIAGLAFVYFTGQDVVRHELVHEIIKAYATKKSSARK